MNLVSAAFCSSICVRASAMHPPCDRPANSRRHSRAMRTKFSCGIDAQQRDDLKVFEGGLDAVVDGRFFVPVEGDPTRYTLAEEGLTLALGFSVVDQLRFGSP